MSPARKNTPYLKIEVSPLINFCGGTMTRNYFILLACLWIVCISGLLKSRCYHKHCQRSNLVLGSENNVVYRELGGYEKLLSRKTHGTDYVSL